jgi:hypothetical protein
MLALPLIFVDLESDRISLTENRMLANRPPLAEIKNPGMFVLQFDEWFKDSTGFREKLLAIYKAVNDENKWLNFVVWYTDGPDFFLIGEKGHHYFAGNGNLIPKFQGKQFLSDEQLLGMARKLEEVKIYLENNKIPLVVMFCADKESIYPEYYPKSIKRGSEPIQLDIITDYLKINTSVDVFNIRQALLTEKNNYLLYYKIDTRAFTGNFSHYNEIGAFFAYCELMKHINKYFPQIIPYKTEDIEISYDEKEIPYVNLKSGFTYKGLDLSSFVDVDPNLFLTISGSYENVNENLPVILFFSDSYSWQSYIGKYFAQQFGKAVFIHWGYVRFIQEYISIFKPDIVVFESAERELISFANHVIGIPKLPYQ